MRGRTNLPQDVVSNVEGGVSIPGIDLNLKFKPTAIATSNDLIRVIYEGGYFVAIGNLGDVAFSKDGKAWEVVTIRRSGLSDIIYADGSYIVVGKDGNDGGMIATSKNLREWKIKEGIKFPADSFGKTNAEITGIAWNGHMYVAFGIGGHLNNEIKLITSEDLETFTMIHLDTFPHVSITRMFYENARFIAIASTGSHLYAAYIAHGTDGVNFNERQGAGLNTVYCNGYFISFGSVNKGGSLGAFRYFRSINGIDWETIDSEETTNAYATAGKIINNCLFINGTYIYLGENKGFYLTDLDEISKVKTSDMFTITNSAKLKSGINNENVLVLVGTGGVVVTADLKQEDRELTMIPTTENQEHAVRLSDNLRLVKVPAVTNVIDANIRPENIKEGISILGITGTYNQPIIN